VTDTIKTMAAAFGLPDRMGGMIEASAILRLSIPCTQLRIDDGVVLGVRRVDHRPAARYDAVAHRQRGVIHEVRCYVEVVNQE